MKGKKFSAAEKHFSKLRDRYDRAIRQLADDNTILREKLEACEKTNKTLTEQVEIYRELLGVDAKDVMSRLDHLDGTARLLDRLCGEFFRPLM